MRPSISGPERLRACVAIENVRSKQESKRQSLRASRVNVSFEIFVDESGSTGPNLNEDSQPVFVHTGLLIPVVRKHDVRALAEQLRLELLPKSDELHVGVLNTANGRKRISRLLPELLAMRVCPLISIMERTIVRAAYLVDTCFDQEWNDKATARYMTSAEARQELSQTLVDTVPQEVMIQFASAFRRRDATAIAAAISIVGEKLRAAARTEEADVLAAAGQHLSEQCEAIRETDNVATAMDTINVSSFAVIAAMGERAADALGFAAGKIIHDQCPQLAAYEWTFNMMRTRADGDIAFDNGQVNVPLRRVANLDAGDSKAEPLLQLADVIAGTYRRLTARTERLRDPAFDEWLLHAMFNANETSNVMVSRQLVETVWSEPLRRFEERTKPR